MKVWRRAAIVVLSLVLSTLGALPASAQALNPTISIENSGLHYADEGSYRPIVRIDGVGPDDSGRILFDAKPLGCSSSVVDPIGAVDVIGPGTVLGPDINRGQLGTFTFLASYTNRTAGGSATVCTSVSVKNRTNTTITLRPSAPKYREPVTVTVKAGNATTATDGDVVATVWVGTTCGSGEWYQQLKQFASEATLTFRGLPIGAHVLQGRFTGDQYNAPSQSPCQRFTVTGDIHGVVFDDRNRDASPQAGEPGLGGVTMRLKRGSTVVSTTKTAADGTYHFAADKAARYTIVQDAAPGYTAATHEQLLDLTMCCTPTLANFPNNAAGQPPPAGGVAPGRPTSQPTTGASGPVGSATPGAVVSGAAPIQIQHRAGTATAGTRSDGTPTTVLVGVAIVILLAGTGAYSWRRSRSTRRQSVPTT